MTRRGHESRGVKQGRPEGQERRGLHDERRKGNAAAWQSRELEMAGKGNECEQVAATITTMKCGWMWRKGRGQYVQ